MSRSDSREATELPLIVFGPALALGATTALFALLAGLFGWHSDEMLVTAAGVGSIVILLAVTLVYLEVGKQRRANRALESAEARVRGILDSAMDAIITVDENQRIVLFNTAAEAVFQCPRAQAIGAPLVQLLPERFRAEHLSHVRHFGETGTSSRRMAGARVVTGLRCNGEEFPIDASISQILQDGRKLYTVILRDVTERVRAEEALDRSRQELRELASRMDSVREQEKSRIARELHDELAQALTALKMDTSWIAEHLPAGQDALAAKLAAMQAMLDGTVAATRRISADLRPLILDDLGLVAAAEWLVQNFTERTGVRCKLTAGDPDLEVEPALASAVFRILQESLTNAARHAQATLVEVGLDGRDGQITLTVRDNGRGFSPEGPRKPNSYGLLGLRERASLLGGEAKIVSETGRGTTVELRLPIPGETAPG